MNPALIPILPLWRINWLRRSLIGLLILALIIVLIPLAAEFAVVRVLLDRGATSAQVDNIDFNPFVGKLKVEQLEYSVAPSPPARVTQLAADLDMKALFKLDVVVEALSLQGVELEVERADNGSVSVNGLRVVDTTGAKVEAADDSNQQTASQPPRFALQSLRLEDVRVNYRETDFQQQLHLPNLELNDLVSWQSDQLTHLVLAARLNDAALKLDARLGLFAQPISVSGRFELDRMQLAHYAKFHREHVESLDGQASVEIDFDLQLGSQVTGTLQSNILLNDLDVQYQGIEQSVRQIGWQGSTKLNVEGLPAVSGELAITQSTTLDRNRDDLQASFVSLSSKLDLEPGIQNSGRLKSLIELSNLDVQYQGIEQSLGQISWQGSTKLNAEGLPAVSGELAITQSATLDRNRDLKASVASLASKLDFEPDEQNSGTLKSLIELSNLDVQYQAIEQSVGQISWQGSTKLNAEGLPAVSGELAITQSATLDRNRDLKASVASLASKLDFEPGEQNSGRLENNLEIAGIEAIYRGVTQSIEKITWQGMVDLEAETQPSVTGQLVVTNSTTRDREQDYLVAGFNLLQLDGVSFRDQQASVGQLQLQQLNLVQQAADSKLLDLEQLSVSETTFDQARNSLTIKQVKFGAPLATVSLDEDKQLEQLAPLMATLQRLTSAPESTDQPAASEAQEPGEAKPLELEISLVELVKAGKVSFSDRSVSPNYQTDLLLNKVKVSSISGQRPAQFLLALQKGEYTLIDVEGEGLLMNPTEQIHVKAKIQQLDLPPITPYSSQAIGYGMKSGVVDSDIDARIRSNQIDSLVRLTIDSIEVVETQKETAEAVASASGMSIDLAISTLMDENNVIKLELPIKGDISKPEFELNDVINQALGKAMRSASLSYLKYALQPFGSLITLFSLAKDAADHISLPPLLFAANSIDFKTDDQQELIDKVLKLLEERPALKLKACAVSALPDQKLIREELLRVEAEKLRRQQQEQQAQKSAQPRAEGEAPPAESAQTQMPEPSVTPAQLQNAMKTLADKRAARVKTYLLDKGGLKPGRILNCLSSSNLDEDSRPVVELQI